MSEHEFVYHLNWPHQFYCKKCGVRGTKYPSGTFYPHHWLSCEKLQELVHSHKLQPHAHGVRGKEWIYKCSRCLLWIEIWDDETLVPYKFISCREHAMRLVLNV